jgi:3-phenylpropionate/cinnamic acid dioxygenase small subunit
MSSDEQAIIRGLGHFARLIDGKLWDRIGEVFAADVSFHYGIGEDQHGIDRLRDQFQYFLDECGGTQHLLGSVIVEVDGNQALSRAYVQARHQRRADPGGPVLDTSGEYIDRWERRPEGWRITRRDATWSVFSGDMSLLPSLSEADYVKNKA